MPDFSPWHLAEDRNKEVQRDNHFEVQITDIVGGELLTLAVQSTNLPTITVPQVELPHGNGVVKVAGQPEFDDVTIEVKDFIGDDIEGKLYQWHNEVYNPYSDEIGMAVDYKKEGYLYQYAPNGDNRRTWNLRGLWPTSFESGDMNYEGSDQKLVTLTLSVDRARREGAGGVAEI